MNLLTTITRHYGLCLALTLGLSQSALAGTEAKTGSSGKAAVFSHFVYQGQDAVYQQHPLKEGEVYSPILQGCYPDPSICRKGNDYYLVNSSFAMFPGVPIFHSTDLRNWEQIGHVLDRESQLKVWDCGISAGIYAPTIRYCKANDTFYMITTEFAGGFGNIVVKTKDPMKGWSDPIKLNFGGIDPSLFFDEDGKAYIVHNDAPEHPLYEGHRCIKIWDYDLATDKIVPGTDRVIVDGGVDITKHPIWIEAPHIYKKDGRYYLMCAEGGTGGNHSEVVFVADNVKGPYTPAPSNPILTQRDLRPNRPNKVDWAGHADLVDTPDGQYYAVFLGVRPNEAGRVNTGRETFMLSVDWSGTFPIFNNGLVPLEPTIKVADIKGVANQTSDVKGQPMPNGNFTFTDDFKATTFDMRWVGVRGPVTAFAKSGKGVLSLSPMATNLHEVKPTSTLFYRQQHRAFPASVTLSSLPKTDKELQGMTCYQSENFNYVFGQTMKDGHRVLLLARTEKGKCSVVAQTELPKKGAVDLQVTANGDKYQFQYKMSESKKDQTSTWQTLGGTVSGDILSTDVAGGFTGSLIGLYATTANDIQL